MDDIHQTYTTSTTRPRTPTPPGRVSDTTSRTSAERTTTDRRGGDANRDPITQEPGSHPVGTGAGSVAGGAAGMAVGALGGPVGALIGGVIGAIAGGAGGHAVAERVDPTTEESYWRENYPRRPYAREDRTFEDYRPAYRYGHEAAVRTHDRRWEDVEGDLRSGWQTHRRDRDLEWNEASRAVRDAWYRTGSHFRDYGEDDAYWRNVHTTRDYFDDSYSYDEDYAPAYRYGAAARDRHPDRDWDDRLEAELRAGWDETRGQSRLGWEKAKDAVRDAWYRATGRREYDAAAG